MTWLRRSLFGAACHRRIDQMWDAHNAVDDKLEPIIIFVSPPQGPQWACLTWELRRGSAQSIESNTPGGWGGGDSGEASRTPVTIKKK